MTEVLLKIDTDMAAEQMTQMLMDENISTYDMLEDLVLAYDNGNDDFKAGMDKALGIIIWKDLPDLVKYMQEHCKAEEESDDEVCDPVGR